MWKVAGFSHCWHFIGPHFSATATSVSATQPGPWRAAVDSKLFRSKG
jgi:hypothetical protein